MTKQSANLDHWSVMNVSFAKAPFKDKTITKMCNYLGKELGCLEQLYASKGKCYAPGSSKWVAYCSVIKSYVMTSTEIQIKQAVYVLEYQVIIHEIFIARMMNKEYCITKANIDEEESKMKDFLKYFAEWKQEQQEFRRTEAKTKNLDWKKYFLAEQTYTNLRLMIAGFFHYARTVLDHADGPEYVPALHSNQSSIEALFSWIRHIGRDSVRDFGGGIGSRNAIRTASNEKVLENNNKVF
jgi:hypothetical protein